EVDITRAEINSREAEQMNRSAAWFDKHYKGMQANRLIVHPAKRIERAAAFTHHVEAVTGSELRTLERACREFFKGFEGQNFADLSAKHIQNMINAHRLSVDDLLNALLAKAERREIRTSVDLASTSHQVTAIGASFPFPLAPTEVG